MNNNKSQLIKKSIAKIDISKIANYQQEYPQSKTLRQIIRYSKRIWDSNNEEEIFKLSVELAYLLDVICDPDKGGYVKEEKEKKYLLKISNELFRNTIGAKEK